MKAGTAGGIEAVVKAINAHIKNADVCEKGCCALLNITFNNRKNTAQIETKQKMKQIAENKVRAGTAGGIETIVKAINTHIDNAEVCVNLDAGYLEV